MPVRVMLVMSAIDVLLRSVMGLMSTLIAANVLVSLIEVVAVAGWQATWSGIIGWAEVTANWKENFRYLETS